MTATQRFPLSTPAPVPTITTPTAPQQTVEETIPTSPRTAIRTATTTATISAAPQQTVEETIPTTAPQQTVEETIPKVDDSKITTNNSISSTSSTTQPLLTATHLVSPPAASSNYITIRPCRIRHYTVAKYITQSANNPHIEQQVLDKSYNNTSHGDAFEYHKAQLVQLIGHLFLAQSSSTHQLIINPLTQSVHCSSLNAYVPTYDETPTTFLSAIISAANNTHAMSNHDKLTQILKLDQLNFISHHHITTTTPSQPQSKRKRKRSHKDDDSSTEEWHVTTTTIDDTNKIADLLSQCVHSPSSRKSNTTKSSINNFFCGFMGSDFFETDTPNGLAAKKSITSEMIRIGKELKDFLIVKTGVPDDAIDWDHVFIPDNQFAISGFGSQGIQLYIKKGFTITMLHDELLWSSAVNLMTGHSSGCSLWISFQWLDASKHFTIKEMSDMTTENRVYDLVTRLIEAQVPLYYFYQGPGIVVESPYGKGSVHIVISHGEYIEQLAFNRYFSVAGASRCLWFWSQQQRQDYNSGLATRHVVPCLTLQHQGFDIGVSEELNYIKKLAHDAASRRINVTMHPEWNACSQQSTDPSSPSSCYRLIDLFAIHDQCPYCNYESKPSPFP